MFSVELKLFWLMINCLERLVLRAINMVSLLISKTTTHIQKVRLKLFLRRYPNQSFARLLSSCALVQDLILGAL